MRCDGWAPFSCGEAATVRAYKGEEYLADLCKPHGDQLMREFKSAGWRIVAKRPARRKR